MGKYLAFSLFQFPNVQNKDNNNSQIIELLWELPEVIKCPVEIQ